MAQAWAAAKAAAAAQAERAVAAQRAVHAYTQRALLLRAWWYKYSKLREQYNRAMSLAERASPDAHAHITRALREPGAPSHKVLHDEVHDATLELGVRLS